MTSKSLIDRTLRWLLDADPAIRWKVYASLSLTKKPRLGINQVGDGSTVGSLAPSRIRIQNKDGELAASRHSAGKEKEAESQEQESSRRVHGMTPILERHGTSGCPVPNNHEVQGGRYSSWTRSSGGGRTGPTQDRIPNCLVIAQDPLRPPHRHR